MKSDSQNYELTFILGEKTTEEDGQKKFETVKELITNAGGTVTKQELWGRRELAYEIQHNRTGFYITIWFQINGSELKDMEQELRFDESIIRFLTTKAYTEAEPGTLYPVADEEKESAKATRGNKEEKTSGEEMLRRSSKPKTTKAETPVENAGEEIPEEERLGKIDEALEVMLKDQE